MRLLAALLLLLTLASCAQPDPGLLFSLSGDHQFTADFAAGNPKPNFLRDVKIIPDGAKGPAFQCANTQVLSYWAPGNIFAQRGTLSFFWRAREPVGPTAFPIFRVGYADSSSWDMVWLRIDYHGDKGGHPGFDAFVTDANLSRTRVSVPLDPFPKPNEWIHLAISWDETQGIRFYVNGKLAAKDETVAVYNTALDQFGPHSRIISPHQVQSDYNYTRGGDLDELRIYDRILSDENIAALAHAQALTKVPPLLTRDLHDPRWRDEWYLRYGWNRPGNPPPALDGHDISIRKVEIHDAYDLKRWYWKALDGIPETTWPGVYNRSRLPGRNDYFQLPDWDCYVDSGKAVTFIMPDEPWNQIEITGAAWGQMDLLQVDAPNDGPVESTLFQRSKGQERTVNRFATAITGRKIRFTNVEQEQPIAELNAYNVTAGREPADAKKLVYKLAAPSGSDIQSIEPLLSFIRGRHPEDERNCLVTQPLMSTAGHTDIDLRRSIEPPSSGLPIVHILLPDDWDALESAYGLDGIALDLPPLNITPTHAGLIPLNIQVKDPLWLMRNSFDFTCSVRPDQPHTLWLDLRDRILPKGKGFYITIACASPEFSALSISNAKVRLVFKPRPAAIAEHELDRFTQVKDCYAQATEEHPHSEKLNMWNRLQGDIQDLVRVNPNHDPGRYYAAVLLGSPLPEIVLPQPPEGVPLWAFRQVELLHQVDNFVDWYISHRQISSRNYFGDLGGGISDDTDLTNTWPGVAFMGAEPERITSSIHLLLEAAFNNGMFTNGLPTIQADELHSYEEGINCLGQNLILDYGNPRQIERAMATQRGIETITGINSAGHRHFRTSYYSGTRMAEDGPWGWQKPYSFLVLQPGQLLVDFNGNPEAKKVLVELADGLLAHRQKDAGGQYFLPAAIHFSDDKEGMATRPNFPWGLFWCAYQWTGDRKYLDPIYDGGDATLLSVDANVVDQLDLRAKWTARAHDFVPTKPAAPVPAWKEPPPSLAPGKKPEEAKFGTREMIPLHADPPAKPPRSLHLAWQLTGDKHFLETLYTEQLRETLNMQYINTEGSLWIDRVGVPYGDLQRARLGGIALLRGSLEPGHIVSWRFAAPATEQSLAILIPDATPTSFKVIAYNLDQAPVHATMTGWNIDPGQWEISQGIDTHNDDTADKSIESHTALFERSSDLDFTFPPRATTILTFKLKTPGTPYWQRPDLGISKDDVHELGHTLKVTIHSLGSVDSPATTIAFRDPNGSLAASASIPALKAPLDLQPKTTEVTLTIPSATTIGGGTLTIDPDNQLKEITRRNNVLRLPYPY